MDPKYANEGQDSTFYFDANLDPYPGFDFDAGSGFNFSLLCRYGFGVPKYRIRNIGVGRVRV